MSLASTPGSSPEKGAGPEPSDKGSAPDEGAAGTDAPAGGEAADANRRGRRARRNRHSGRPAQPASANARTDSSKTTKRKRQILEELVTVTELASVKSRLDFGEQGRANASSLEFKCGAEPGVVNSGQIPGVLTIHSFERNERKSSEIPTSSGELSGFVRRARMESTEGGRGVYHNLTARAHKECFKFGGCKCGGMPAGAPASVTEPVQSVAGGRSVGDPVTEQTATGGTADEDDPGSPGVSPADAPASAPEPMLSPADGGGSKSDDTEGTEQADEGDPGTPRSSNGAAASGGAKQGCMEGHMTVDDGDVAECIQRSFVGPDGNDASGEDAGRTEGQDGSVGPDAQDAADSVLARRIAEQLIHEMSPEVRQEFVVATIDTSSLDPAAVEAAVKNMTMIGSLLGDDSRQPGNRVPYRRASRQSGGRGRIVAGSHLWKSDSRGSRKCKLAKTSPPAYTPPLVLSEKNKEHLIIIATSIISDMMPAIRRLVAKDPRIERWSLSNSPRFKEKIKKEYRDELKARRKSDIVLLQAAAALSKNAVSTKSYRAIRHILKDMGVEWVLPTERDLGGANKILEDTANKDLSLYSTPDGWFASLRQVVEHELDHLCQMPAEKTTREEAGGRSLGHSGPGMHAWQDTVYVKITLDARRITKRCSVTEVMLHIFRKGEQRATESQKALCMRTMGMWMGKDCRENVVANATRFFQECQSLQTEGVMFDSELCMFLGGTMAFSRDKLETLSDGEAASSTSGGEQGQANGKPGGTKARLPADKKRYVHVPVKFWFPADMAAQCAVIGHGCAGDHYCAHCMAHENERHLPYELVITTEDTSLQAMAHEHDMHARTLYAINTGVDHLKVQILTEGGLRESTVLNAEARALAPEPEPEVDPGGERRQPKKRKEAPRPKNGPDVRKLEPLVGWKANHPLACRCSQCVIPAGTCVRVIPRLGFSRPSAYLKNHFKDLTADRCPFCALHCKMRVAEALFQQICKAAETSQHESRLVASMNTALKSAGINKKYQKNQTSKSYEKITFEGHQVKALLKQGAEGKMAIENVLDAMWPGAAEDPGVGKQYGTKFVPRTIAVWRQFAVVEKLMCERDPQALKKDIINGEDGFDRFGKECREFIFRFQSMSTLDYSKAYYLHTLLHHAGDFMRALQAEGFTLGMMSNSGAERRHEYGRRASRKALASNGWRKKNPEYDKKENLIIYLTLKEILKWDYGEDLISYIIAKRIQDGTVVIPDGCNVDFSKITTRKDSRAKDEEKLLSEEEARKEYDAQPDDVPPEFETSNTKFWARSGKKNAYALVGVEADPEEGSDEAGKMFDPDHELKLFSWVPLAFSHDDESDAGSEADVYDLTINDLDFGDEDEDNDESYTAVEVDERSERLEWDMEKEDYRYPAMSKLALRSCRPNLQQAEAMGPEDRDEVIEWVTVSALYPEANGAVSRRWVPIVRPRPQNLTQPAAESKAAEEKAGVAIQETGAVTKTAEAVAATFISEQPADDDGTRRNAAPPRRQVRGRGRGRGAIHEPAAGPNGAFGIQVTGAVAKAAEVKAARRGRGRGRGREEGAGRGE